MLVDLTRRHCFPVYWNGENRRVLRGHWFARKGGLDWLPLREDVAEQLEIAYRSQGFDTVEPFNRQAFLLLGLICKGLYALFTGEDDTWEAWLNVDASGFSSFVNLSGNGIKDELRQRKEEEMDDYCSQAPNGDHECSGGGYVNEHAKDSSGFWV
ncbi:Phospholipase sgr2 [Orobanche gracilis]